MPPQTASQPGPDVQSPSACTWCLAVGNQHLAPLQQKYDAQVSEVQESTSELKEQIKIHNAAMEAKIGALEELNVAYIRRQAETVLDRHMEYMELVCEIQGLKDEIKHGRCVMEERIGAQEERLRVLGDTGADIAKLNQDVVRFGAMACASKRHLTESFARETEKAWAEEEGRH